MISSFFHSDVRDIGSLDLVIHTPARLMTIMLLNRERTLDFIQLMSFTDLTWGNLSTHLSKLEEAGYVMIAKTFKGKRPHTLVTLTEAGRQAYQQWSRTIIKALPQAADWERQEITALNRNAELPLIAGRDVFFLPRYHRWGMELPPVKEFNPLA
jgi:DNA-binding MarR family transcriptional regulator